MKRIIFTLLTVVLFLPIIANAQQGGALIGGIGLGLNTPTGDFSDPIGLSGGTGLGIEAELRYYLWGGFGVGGFANYSRFSSGYQLPEGRISYNFNQVGGLVKMNFIRLSKGRLYLTGGGGIFTPNVHFYVPDASYDVAGYESGVFYFGGIGLISETYKKMLYELEIRYNMGTADFEVPEISEDIFSNWNFLYVGLKLSFASKGKPAPPRF
jgi:hypothetical protein